MLQKPTTIRPVSYLGDLRRSTFLHKVLNLKFCSTIGVHETPSKKRKVIGYYGTALSAAVFVFMATFEDEEIKDGPEDPDEEDLEEIVEDEEDEEEEDLFDEEGA